MNETLDERRKYQVILSASDKARLRKILQSPNILPLEHKFIQILFAFDESGGKLPQSVPVVAKEFGVSTVTAVRIRKRFAVSGVDVAVSIGNFGVKSNIKLPETDRLKLLQLANSDSTEPNVKLRSNILLDSDTSGENKLSVNEIAQKYNVDEKIIDDTRRKYVCLNLGRAIMDNPGKRFAKHPVILSPREKAMLRDILETDNYSSTVKSRAQVLLALDESDARVPRSISSVAKQLGRSFDYIARVKNQYHDSDMGFVHVLRVDSRKKHKDKYTIALCDTKRKEVAAIAFREDVPPQVKRWAQIILDSDTQSNKPRDPEMFLSIRKCSKYKSESVACNVSNSSINLFSLIPFVHKRIKQPS